MKIEIKLESKIEIEFEDLEIDRLEWNALRIELKNYLISRCALNSKELFSKDNIKLSWEEK